MNNTPAPEQAQLLPLYILAALKHPVLKDGTDIRSDERIALMTALGVEKQEELVAI
ncbi:hypothetical protein T484DRAFT_1810589 [Baffinella frigidus]|nr:hypothetical protein T484DRAFT_1810589 [Cryptophyta sp. CCMP2293]